MGHARLVRAVALELLPTHLQGLRQTRMPQPSSSLNPQQRLWGKPLNPASCQGRLWEEWARGLKDHLAPLEEPAKETEERSEPRAEELEAATGRVPQSAPGTKKRLDSRKSLSVRPYPVNRNLQNAAW